MNADNLLMESEAKDVVSRLRGLLGQVESSEDRKRLKEALESLLEEMSSSDWTRVGAIAGVLWYKLDTLIDVFKKVGSDMSSIKSDVGDIRRKLT